MPRRLSLPYGQTTIEVEVPDGTEVIEPRFLPGLTDARAAIIQALRAPMGRPPLGEMLRPGDRVCVVVPDITRPAPTRLIAQCLREEAGGAALHFLVGTGAHRPCSRAELEFLLGPEGPGMSHDARDPEVLRLVGHTPTGTAVWLNRHYLEADRRIAVGLIEPHFFAGFSGGPKAIVPGIAGLETILAIHSAPLIAHPNTTGGRLDGNPVQEEIAAACGLAPPDLLVNVSINRRREVTGVFVGELREAHRRGCEFVRQAAMRQVDGPFDIVVTTNGGWPLDQNLYQTVKGIAAASRITKPGGCIVAVAECRMGFPPGNFAELLFTAGSPDELSDRIFRSEVTVEDQWEAQVLCKILKRATVFLHSALDPSEVRRAFVHPVATVAEGLERARRLRGPDATIAVLPEGPFTIPCLPEHAQ